MNLNTADQIQKSIRGDFSEIFSSLNTVEDILEYLRVLSLKIGYLFEQRTTRFEKSKLEYGSLPKIEFSDFDPPINGVFYPDLHQTDHIKIVEAKTPPVYTPTYDLSKIGLYISFDADIEIVRTKFLESVDEITTRFFLDLQTKENNLLYKIDVEEKILVDARHYFYLHPEYCYALNYNRKVFQASLFSELMSCVAYRNPS